MKEPIWVSKAVVLAMHDELLAEHGGTSGIHDEALLDSALHRPLNILAYGARDLFTLATAYISGIVRNHPFMDGNKRTAYVTGGIFLERNGKTLIASEEEATEFMLALVSKKITDDDFTRWLKDCCK